MSRPLTTLIVAYPRFGMFGTKAPIAYTVNLDDKPTDQVEAELICESLRTHGRTPIILLAIELSTVIGDVTCSMALHNLREKEAGGTEEDGEYGMSKSQRKRDHW